jgi:hypothetical protein
MKPDGDDLAVVVQAYQFDLLDPQGIIAASLATGTGTFQGGLNLPFDGLELKHRDAATSDSSLRWTHPGTAGIEMVQLMGAGNAGSAENRPRSVYGRTNNPAVATFASITAGRPDGAFPGGPGPGFGPSLSLQRSAAGVDTAILATDTAVKATLSDQFTDRGTIYGLSIHRADNAAGLTNLTVAAQTLATINLPDCPLTSPVWLLGQTLFVSQAAGGPADLWIEVDGARATPFGQFFAAVGDQATVVTQVLSAITAGLHTVTLRASVQAVNNSYAFIGNQYTNLAVFLMR